MALGVRKRRDGSVVAGRWDHEQSRVDEGIYPSRHHFPTKWLNKALAEGWASLSRGNIVLHAADGDVVYRIERAPGAYCVHCGEKLGEGAARNPAQVAPRLEHVATYHEEDVVDPANPAGYEVTDHYDAMFVAVETNEEVDHG